MKTLMILLFLFLLVGCGDDKSPEPTPPIPPTPPTQPPPPPPVEPINIAPSSATATAVLDEDTAVSFIPTVVDIDDSEHLFAIVDVATDGTASVLDGELMYYGNENFHGTDSFTFKATDSSGNSIIGTALITVKPVNDAPTIQSSHSGYIEPETPFLVTPTVTDVDTGDNYSISISTAPTNGTATINPDGKSFSFISNPGFIGLEVIDFVITDSGGLTARSSTSLNVLPRVIVPVVTQITNHAEKCVYSPRVEATGNKVALLWNLRRACVPGSVEHDGLSDNNMAFSFNYGESFIINSFNNNFDEQFTNGGNGEQFLYLSEHGDLYRFGIGDRVLRKNTGFNGTDWVTLFTESYDHLEIVDNSIYKLTVSRHGLDTNLAIGTSGTWTSYDIFDSTRDSCSRPLMTPSPDRLHIMYNCNFVRMLDGLYYTKYQDGVITPPIRIADSILDLKHTIYRYQAVDDNLYFMGDSMFFPHKKENGDLHVLKSEDGVSWTDIFVRNDEVGILDSAIPKKVWMDESLNIYAFNEVDGRDGHLVLRVHDYNSSTETWDFEGKNLTDAFSLVDIWQKDPLAINYEMDMVETNGVIRFVFSSSPRDSSATRALFTDGPGNIFYFQVPFK